MRKRGAGVALLACTLALAWIGSASPGWAAESTRPPTGLKKVGDHWTPWDAPPAGPNDYIIKQGDTLWDLAQEWLGNPYLWPQVWDLNRYVQDSHWIYPGDPLVRPGQPTVVPPGEGALPVEDETAPPPPTPPVTRAEDAEPPQPLLVPVADQTDLYCSGYIEHAYEQSQLRVFRDQEIRRISMAEGDVIYLTQGRDAGIEAGQEYSIIRRTTTVLHPRTQRDLGEMVLRIGKVRVMMAHDTTSTALVEASCDEVRIDDELVPWQSIPVPMRSTMPAFVRYDPTPSGGAQGTVVSMQHDLNAVATGHLIYTDLGRTSGVQPGDVLTVYREPELPGLPRRNLGQAVVLTVGYETSAAKIVSSVIETTLGDSVEIVR